MSELPSGICLLGIVRDASYRPVAQKLLLEEERDDPDVRALRTMYAEEIPQLCADTGTGWLHRTRTWLHRFRTAMISNRFVRRLDARGGSGAMDWSEALWCIWWSIMTVFIPVASSVLFFQVPAYEAVARQMTVYPRILFGKLLFAWGYGHKTSEIFRLTFELQLLSGLFSVLTYLPLINVPGGRALYGDALTRWPVIGGTALFMFLVTTRTPLFKLLQDLLVSRKFSPEIRQRAADILARHQQHRTAYEALLKRHEDWPTNKYRNMFWYGPVRVNEWVADQNSCIRADLEAMEHQIMFISAIPASFANRFVGVFRDLWRDIKRTTATQWIIFIFTVVVTLFVILPFYKSAIVIATAATWGMRIILLMIVAILSGKLISELLALSGRTVSLAVADLPLIVCLLSTHFEGLNILSNLIPLSILATIATLTVTDCILAGILWALFSMKLIKEEQPAPLAPAEAEGGVELRG